MYLRVGSGRRLQHEAQFLSLPRVAISFSLAVRAEKSNFIQAVDDWLRAKIGSGHYLAKGYPADAVARPPGPPLLLVWSGLSLYWIIFRFTYVCCEDKIKNIEK